MLTVVCVVLLCPSQDFGDLNLNFRVKVCLFCIARDIQAVYLFKQIYEFFFVESVVNRHNSCAPSHQELYVRGFKVS